MKAIESVRLEECHGIESWNGENGVASKLRTPKVFASRESSRAGYLTFCYRGRDPLNR